MEGLCLGPWVMLVYLTCWMDGGMWMCAAGSCQGRQSPEWGQVGPLITVLGGKPWVCLSWNYPPSLLCFWPGVFHRLMASGAEAGGY